MDAAFASSPMGFSQVCIFSTVVTHACEGGGFRFAPIGWASRASARVCRSTFGAETFASAEGLNEALVRQQLLNEMLGTKSVAILVSDARSVTDAIHSYTFSMQEKIWPWTFGP